MTTQAQRNKLNALMKIMVNNEHKIHYGQVRPMVTVNEIHDVNTLIEELGTRTGITMDCSESVTLLCKLAGMNDPNGNHYDGIGNTQMMYDHLKQHYEKPEYADVGALCWFGIPGVLSTQHITMVHHTGKDPVLFSHGSEKGPIFINYSEEQKFHSGTPVFLSVAHL